MGSDFIELLKVFAFVFGAFLSGIVTTVGVLRYLNKQ